MKQVFHDFIIIDPDESKGVLKSVDNDIHSGIVKEFGRGYWSDTGSFVDQIQIQVGDRVLFTQHMKFDENGEEIYIIRGRDVIQATNDKT